MERIEVFESSNRTLCVEIYKNMNDENSVMFFKGEKAISAVKSLGKEKIYDVFENTKTDELILTYKHSIVRLNEYTHIMYKSGMRDIRNNIKKFEEIKALNKIKKKKVTRENKYIGKVIIPISIVSIIAISTVLAGYNDSNFLSSTLKEYEPQLINITQSIEDSTMPLGAVNELEEIPETPVFISYDNRSETDKASFTRNNYWDLIEKYSKMYGLDPNLVLAIATQERGVHSSVMDEGGATGLMQVQNDVWENYNKTSYNFETGEYETFLITFERIQDLEQNIKIGCTIFQECLQNMNYNIPAAIQCYNMGQGSMYQILNAYSIDTGKTVDEILNDPNDVGWLDYRYTIPYGDQNYVENVLSWMGDSNTISVLKENNEEVTLTIKNNVNEKKQVIC